MLRHILAIILVFALPSALFAQGPGFIDKWESPFSDAISKKILLVGAGLAGLLYVNRAQIGDPLQKDWSKNGPMGKLAEFGDIMGQLVPNVSYIAAAHFFGDDGENRRRRNLMFDATLYTGLTVTVLKRLVGEERPNGGDNLSFPSGHTATAFAFAGVVGIEHEWYWALPAYAIAGIVGASRINDNAHYLHDVVAGAALGLGYAYGLKALEDRENGAKLSIIPMDGGGGVNYSWKF